MAGRVFRVGAFGQVCGRFNMTDDPLTRLFMALAGVPFPGPDRLNVAPTERAPVVCVQDAGRAVVEMRWWLVPHWSRAPDTRYAMFNARSETLTRSNAFREPFARRRCVVPVTGFFEWWTGPDGRKVPHYVTAGDGEGLRLAGVWDRWERGDEVLESFALITTSAHAALRWLHDRQPVLLDEAGAARWLDEETTSEDLLALCRPHLVEPLIVHPMNPLMSNARYKGPACLAPDGPGRTLDATSADAEPS
jgi:putative SOS response-associated peptidase YedK